MAVNLEGGLFGLTYTEYLSIPAVVLDAWQILREAKVRKREMDKDLDTWRSDTNTGF